MVSWATAHRILLDVPTSSKHPFPILFLSIRASQDLATSGPETALHPEGWRAREPAHPIPDDHTIPTSRSGQASNLETELGARQSFWA